MLKISSPTIRSCISKLASNIRAENIEYDSYIDLYSGAENIQSINNRNNTVIYGRRGSGKTHLLKALKEKLASDFDTERNFPVYVDLRRIVPLLSSESNLPDISAILIFKYLMQELALSLSINTSKILGINEFDPANSLAIKERERTLIELFKNIYLEFDGRKFTKPSSLTVSEEEVKSLGGSAILSKNPSVSAKADFQSKSSGDKKQDSYISILDITNEIEYIIDYLNINRITLILDEWSEVDFNTQLYLAEILKKSFSAISVSLKIAAIPNRTNLGIRTDQKFFGLEDGGDIFGYHLDMRYVFEVNKPQTRNFFNDLIYRHLHSLNATEVSDLIKQNKTSSDKLINLRYPQKFCS